MQRCGNGAGLFQKNIDLRPIRDEGRKDDFRGTTRITHFCVSLKVLTHRCAALRRALRTGSLTFTAQGSLSLASLSLEGIRVYFVPVVAQKTRFIFYWLTHPLSTRGNPSEGQTNRLSASGQDSLNPRPMISLEFVMMMKALGSTDLARRRSLIASARRQTVMIMVFVPPVYPPCASYMVTP